MEAQQVAERYAQGLFDLTQERGSTATVHEELDSLMTVLKQDDSFVRFLAAPQIRENEKVAVVAKVFQGKFSDQLFHLLELLVTKHRTSYLLEIAAAYERLFNENKGIVATRLITAVPLTQDEIAKIRARLNKLTGHSVDIETEQDPSIIGGVIAFVGDKIIDRSIRHELDLLREQLLELKVS